MWKVTIGLLVLTGLAVADKTPSLIGTWRVVGCVTSPKDPANCAKGTIVFDAKRWSVELAGPKRSKAYKVVSESNEKIEIDSEGEVSVIRFDADGRAHWNPRIGGGRFTELSFVREKPAPDR